MADGDYLNIIETNESPEPSYDSSTHRIHDPDLNDGKGGTREPSVHETVRAAMQTQKAERDPIERYRQQAQKNGTSLERVLEQVEEYDNIAGKDAVEGIRHLVTRYGYNPQAVAQHLWNGTSPTGNAAEATKHAASVAIANFDRVHYDPVSKQLRPLAAKVLEKGDKRLDGCRSDAEALDRAFAIAWQDLPRNKAARGVVSQLEERDSAREEFARRAMEKRIAKINNRMS